MKILCEPPPPFTLAIPKTKFCYFMMSALIKTKAWSRYHLFLIICKVCHVENHTLGRRTKTIATCYSVFDPAVNKRHCLIISYLPVGGGTQNTNMYYIFVLVKLTLELQNSSPPLHSGPHCIQNEMFRASKSQLVILAESFFSLEFHFFEELLATTWLSCVDKSSYNSLNHNLGRAF